MVSAFKRRRQTWSLVITVAAIVVIGSLGFVVASMGWPGEADPCTLPGGNCYCETMREVPKESLAKQPANTWSNLAPIAVGLGIIAVTGSAATGRRTARSASAMSGGWQAFVYGLLVISLGLGSMAFHASLTRAGGWLDTLSMIAFVTYVLVYDIACIRGHQRDPWRVVGAWAAVTGVLGLGTWEVPGSGTTVFTILVAIVIVLELAIATSGIGDIRRPSTRWLLAALVTFGAATIVWRLSWTGGLLCDPTSLLQGHALWHVLAEAVVPLMVFTHLWRGDGQSTGASELRPN